MYAAHILEFVWLQRLPMLLKLVTELKLDGRQVRFACFVLFPCLGSGNGVLEHLEF